MFTLFVHVQAQPNPFGDQGVLSDLGGHKVVLLHGGQGEEVRRVRVWGRVGGLQPVLVPGTCPPLAATSKAPPLKREAWREEGVRTVK